MMIFDLNLELLEGFSNYDGLIPELFDFEESLIHRVFKIFAKINTTQILIDFSLN
jgi:hypothetical protein